MQKFKVPSPPKYIWLTETFPDRSRAGYYDQDIHLISRGYTTSGGHDFPSKIFPWSENGWGFTLP